MTIARYNRNECVGQEVGKTLIERTSWSYRVSPLITTCKGGTASETKDDGDEEKILDVRS